jgi:hypothetical protein
MARQERWEDPIQSASPLSYQERLTRIKAQYPRAYERWTLDEERQLAALVEQGLNVKAIAQALQRQPSAIHSRLRRLAEGKGLIAAAGEAQAPLPGDNTPWHEPVSDGETAFFPLAVSAMQYDAVCVAGVNVDDRAWLRLVRPTMHSMDQAGSSPFVDRQLSALVLGVHQPRPLSLDPRQLHVEDRIIAGPVRRLRDLSPLWKLEVCDSLVDSHLEQSLADRRSLFLVEPTWFRIIPRPGSTPKIAFQTATTDTDALRASEVLAEAGIGVSSQGCPCNCLTWARAGAPFDQVRSLEDLVRHCPGARVFFVLSLTGWPIELPKERQKHYLLVAGIHVLGEDRVWL